ncbi:MAG: NUDIX hydrolase, partial [Bacteroidota bacterium]
MSAPRDPRCWRLRTSEIAFSSPWYTLRRDTVELPDGRIVDDYFVSMRPEVALIFAVTPDRKAVLVRQYKHGAAEMTLEFPGGVFEAGQEVPAVAAARELAEETGYVAEKMEALGAMWDDPTRQNNRIHYFLAHDARPLQSQNLDPLEDIEVVEVA